MSYGGDGWTGDGSAYYGGDTTSAGGDGGDGGPWGGYGGNYSGWTGGSADADAEFAGASVVGGGNPSDDGSCPDEVIYQDPDGADLYRVAFPDDVAQPYVERNDRLGGLNAAGVVVDFAHLSYAMHAVGVQSIGNSMLNSGATVVGTATPLATSIGTATGVTLSNGYSFYHMPYSDPTVEPMGYNLVVSPTGAFNNGGGWTTTFPPF